MKTVDALIIELDNKYFDDWYGDNYFDAYLEDYGFDVTLQFSEPSIGFHWSPVVDNDTDENEIEASQFYVGQLEFIDIQRETGITEEESKELFKTWIQEKFLKHGKFDTSLFGNIYSTWIPMLIEVEYFKIYSVEELMEIFGVTGREDLLPKNIQDVFLF